VLFYYRRLHREARSQIGFPTDLKKFISVAGDSIVLNEEKLRNHLKLPRAPGLPKILSCDDLRPVSYGHDIARVFFAIWKELRTTRGIATSDDLERLMLTYVRPTDLTLFPLFAFLAAWATTRPS
jgi:hypothetical protein